MEDSLAILIPLSLLLVFAIGLILWWSVRSGQFDDLEGPAYRLIMDDDDEEEAQASKPGAGPEMQNENENSRRHEPH